MEAPQDGRELERWKCLAEDEMMMRKELKASFDRLREDALAVAEELHEGPGRVGSINDVNGWLVGLRDRLVRAAGGTDGQG